MKPKHPGKLLLALMATAITAIAMVAPSAQAVEVLQPGYTQFEGCKSLEEEPLGEACLLSTITGGHFQMGSKTVPIEQPIPLAATLLPGGDLVWNSKGGLKPVKLEIPGGVVGITGLEWLVNFLTFNQLRLYAVTETVGTPNLTDVLKLPIRVHLVNSVLGNNCYVGSAANPISLNLITGTTAPPAPNEPITGREADFSFDEELEIIHLDDGIFVDNSFAAPAAKGCVLTLFGFLPISLDPLVNLQAGLPSAAGTNETVQNWEAEIVNPEIAYN